MGASMVRFQKSHLKQILIKLKIPIGLSVRGCYPHWITGGLATKLGTLNEKWVVNANE